MAKKRAATKEQMLSAVLTIRLTADEMARYEAKVAAAGQTKSEFFREVVLANKTVVVAARPASNDKKALVGQVALIGNNLNQIARVLNEARRAGSVTEATFNQFLDALESIEGRCVEVLGHVE